MKKMILFACLFTGQALAAEAYMVEDAAKLTTIAGQPAALMGQQMVFFVPGHQRQLKVGDWLVCNQPGQVVAEVAQNFASNPFTAKYARSMRDLSDKGYTLLDSGCIPGRDHDGAVEAFRKAGGTIDDETSEAPAHESAAKWNPVIEWSQWVTTSPEIAVVDVENDLTPAQANRWRRILVEVQGRTSRCPDPDCFYAEARLALPKLAAIKKEHGL